jgi:hypothetical protein
MQGEKHMNEKGVRPHFERWKEIAAGPEADIDLVEAALLVAARLN